MPLVCGPQLKERGFRVMVAKLSVQRSHLGSFKNSAASTAPPESGFPLGCGLGCRICKKNHTPHHQVILMRRQCGSSCSRGLCPLCAFTLPDHPSLFSIAWSPLAFKFIQYLTSFLKTEKEEKERKQTVRTLPQSSFAHHLHPVFCSLRAKLHERAACIAVCGSPSPFS